MKWNQRRFKNPQEIVNLVSKFLQYGTVGHIFSINLQATNTMWALCVSLCNVPLFLFVKTPDANL